MSIYDELPVELLIGFYTEIKKNIDKGILSKRMYLELELIRKAARKRGIEILPISERTNSLAAHTKTFLKN